MKNTACNRPLLVWTLAQLALAFVLVVPFSLTPAVWGGLLAFGAAAFVCAMFFDQKVPRVLTRVSWVIIGIIQTALMAYLVYALFFFVPDATTGYDAESRATILSATLAPLTTLYWIVLPSQAAVASRSKADARRVRWTAVFSFVYTAALYGYGVIVRQAVAFVADSALKIVLSVVAVLTAFCVLAVAFRGLFAQKGQQKTAPDEESEAAE